MRLNTNAWNRIRYTVWAPIYDRIVARFEPFRRSSIESLELAPGERVLLVGAGTGADLKHLPGHVRVLATDLTAGMLRRARDKASEGVRFAVMDGHQLALPAASFDVVVLHLIVAVIPDPVECIREVARVVRAGGRVAVFDKFVRGDRAPLALRVANVLTAALFTEVTRNLERIVEEAGVPLRVERDTPVALGGLFRQVLLRRL